MKTAQITTILIVMFVFSISYGEVIHVPDEYATIQAGINAAYEGDTVLVASGNYKGEGNRSISFMGKAIVVMSEQGPEETVINCELLGNGFVFDDYETNNSMLQGFQTLNGKNFWGGGIYCYQSSPIIANCILSHNKAQFGGGMYVYGPASPQVENCLISENESEYSGGGLYHNEDAAPVYNNCVIVDNISGDAGGGVYCYTDAPIFTNCIIARNVAENQGAGFYTSFGATPEIINCVIADNVAGYGGSALAGWEGNPYVSNSILWNNTPTEIDINNGFPEIRYCDVRGGFTGTGNIDEDPNFIDFAGHQYLLRPNSPCIDIGDPLVNDYLYEWHPRWPQWYADGARSDMGAYGGPGNIYWFKY